MWAVQRTWEVFVGNEFLGYEYAVEESDALAKTIIKFGSPEKWGADAYTVKKIKWAEEDI